MTRLAWLRRHGPFLVLLGLTLSWRLFFAFHWPLVQVSDYQAYYEEARSLAGLGSRGYSALNAWGPKLLYAVPTWLLGDGLRLLGAVNASLYALSLVFLYLGTRRAFDGACATLTIAVCLFSLSEVYFTNLACTEIPGTLLMCVLFWLMTHEPTPRILGALGVVCGLAIFNRSNMLVFPALVFLYEAARTRRLWAPLRQAALVQAIALVVTVPVCVLNLRHFGSFTPVVANSAGLWWGNNPKLSGDAHSYPPTPEDLPLGSPARQQLVEEYRSFYLNPDAAMEFAKLPPHDASAVRARYALGWIRRNPTRYLRLIGARFVLLFWSCTYGEAPYRGYDPSDPKQPRWLPAHRRLIERARLPVRSLYRILISLAGIGVLLTLLWHRRWGTGVRVVLPLLIVAYYSVPFLLTVAANRYHIPILGLCWTYVASGILLLGRAATPSVKRAFGRERPAQAAAGDLA